MGPLQERSVLGLKEIARKETPSDAITASAEFLFVPRIHRFNVQVAGILTGSFSALSLLRGS